MKVKFLLLIGLLCMGGSVSAQELLCPNTGIPMAQDPGCTTPNYGSEPGGSPSRAQPAQPLGYWEDSWGAIFTSNGPNTFGFAAGKESEAAAKQAALAACKRYGGTNCISQISYYNGCAAIVMGDRLFTVEYGDTENAAKLAGMKKCLAGKDSNCRVKHSSCSPPVFHRY